MSQIIESVRRGSVLTTSRIAARESVREIIDLKDEDGNPIAEDALVDSGADTGSLGKAFKILNQDDMRKINVYGCRAEFVAKGLRIGDGITLATDKDNNKILIRYNEGIIDPNGKSILSVAQMRNYQVGVEDKPCCYGGRQMLETLEEVHLPLMMKGGLAHLTIQFPTQDDLETYPTIELTSDLPWDPDDCEIYSASNRNVLELRTKKEEIDLEKVHPCLG